MKLFGDEKELAYCPRLIVKNSKSRTQDIRFAILAWMPLLFALVILTWSWYTQGIAWIILSSDIDPSEKIEKIKSFFDSFGTSAPLIYVLCVTIEVTIAPIPGLMLYAPGGVIFGGFQGGLLSLIGNTLGAGICCAAVRGIGDAWMQSFFSKEKLEVTQSELNRRGVWLIFLLRINPLTSSDLISYAAGLTRIPIWKVMTATAAGMAPLCFAQAYLADNIMRRYPWLLYPLLGFCIIYLFAIVFILNRIRKTPKNHRGHVSKFND